MTTQMTCSWCETMTAERDCPNCGHRADLTLKGCDCVNCRDVRPPIDEAGNTIAVGDAVEFVEPYCGFAGGTVVELLRGVMGPIAGVQIAPNRTADTLCRRLRKAI
ncbi:MAG: hypothetical protein K8U57_20480 [Planctomycetes bacterium]|nr:hypothetical protein [Planctomycetota bacterium]